MAKQRRRRQSASKRAAFNLSQLKQDVDTYTDAIYAVLALVHHARWDRDAKKLRDVSFGIGRRFHTSKANRVSPDRSVTPDCAIQLSANAGIIAEAKPGVTRLRRVWEDNLKQLMKYDDDLTGWWTNSQKLEFPHEILALVPQSRVIDFIDLMNEQIADKAVAFSRRPIVLAFVKSTGAEDTHIMLKTESGQVSDPQLREPLRRSVPINWQHILVHYKDTKFIDAEPPLPYTLFVLWDYVFNKKASGRQNEPNENWIAVDVEVAALTRDVQEFFGFRSDGERSVEIPRVVWIRRALEALVIFSMAKRLSEQTYQVRYRRYKMAGDTVAFFGRLQFRHADRLARNAQRKPLLELAEAAAPLSSDDATETPDLPRQ